MSLFDWKIQLKPFDDRRALIIPGNRAETVEFCAKAWTQLAAESIAEKGSFFVALSGGSTPNAIYKKLTEEPYAGSVDWSRVFCFWSDERNVPDTDIESNYFTAMKSGLGKLPFSKDHIFRMEADPSLDLERCAEKYQEKIFEYLKDGRFDLVMLGIGEDGHTASLFPHTTALHASKDRWVAANYIPAKKVWRLTFTYHAINAAGNIWIYALGENKAEIVSKALLGHYEPEHLPVQRVGTAVHPAVWIMDNAAASRFMPELV